MKFHHLGRCAVVVAVALTAWPTLAQDKADASAKSTLLQSEIEVTWQDKAQGLAQLLADRLGVPFTSAVPLDTQVSVKQAGGSTVANLISTVNRQLPRDQASAHGNCCWHQAGSNSREHADYSGGHSSGTGKRTIARAD